MLARPPVRRRGLDVPPPLQRVKWLSCARRRGALTPRRRRRTAVPAGRRAGAAVDAALRHAAVLLDRVAEEPSRLQPLDRRAERDLYDARVAADLDRAR